MSGGVTCVVDGRARGSAFGVGAGRIAVRQIAESRDHLGKDRRSTSFVEEDPIHQQAFTRPALPAVIRLGDEVSERALEVLQVEVQV